MDEQLPKQVSRKPASFLGGEGLLVRCVGGMGSCALRRLGAHTTVCGASAILPASV